MAEIINLRMVRKAKARSEKDRLAEENRARHGRGKADRQRERALDDKAAAFIEGHRREGAPTSLLKGVRDNPTPQGGGVRGGGPPSATTLPLGQGRAEGADGDAVVSPTPTSGPDRDK